MLAKVWQQLLNCIMDAILQALQSAAKLFSQSYASLQAY